MNWIGHRLHFLLTSFPLMFLAGLVVSMQSNLDALPPKSLYIRQY